VSLAKSDLVVMLIFLPGYIGEFELVDDHRAGKIVVELNGRLNKCGVISPRYNIGVAELEDWTARLLPSRQVCSPKPYLLFRSPVLLCYMHSSEHIYDGNEAVSLIANTDLGSFLHACTCLEMTTH
jgi:ribosomal protein S8